MKRFTLVLAMLLLVGCTRIDGPNRPIPNPTPNPTPTPGVTYPAVVAALAGVSVEDRANLHGIFSAHAAYLKDGATGIKTTGQLRDVVVKVLKLRHWQNGKHPALGAAVSDVLTKEFSEDAPLDEATRNKAATVFQTLANSFKATR